MNPLKTKWLPQPFKKNSHGGVKVIFSHLKKYLFLYMRVVSSSLEKFLSGNFIGGGEWMD